MADSEYTPTDEEVRFAFIDRKYFEDQLQGSEIRSEATVNAAFARFLARVRAEERERCAAVAEKAYPLGAQVLGDAPSKVAAAIRALPSTPETGETSA